MTLWQTRLLEFGWLCAYTAAIVTAFEWLPFGWAYAVSMALLGLTVAVLGRRGR